MRTLVFSLLVAGTAVAAVGSTAVAAPSYEYDIPVLAANDYYLNYGRYWGGGSQGRWGPDRIDGENLLYATDYHNFWYGYGDRLHNDAHLVIDLDRTLSATSVVGAVLRIQVHELYAPRQDAAHGDLFVGSDSKPNGLAATLSGLTPGQFDIDVTNPLKEILAFGDGSVRFLFSSCWECSAYNTVGFALAAAESGAGARLLIDVGDAGAVSTVPLPGAISLLVPALASLGWIGRARRRSR